MRFRHITALLISGAALAGALSACSSTSSSQVSSEITTTTSTAKPQETTTTTLEPEAGVGRISFVYGPIVGDCIDHRSVATGRAVTVNALPVPDASIKSDKDVILRMSCDLPHQYEVISVAEAGLPTQPPPTYEQMVAIAKRKCPAAWSEYIGVTYSSSSLEVGWTIPTDEQRSRGIQTIGCLAFDPKGKTTGSLHESRR